MKNQSILILFLTFFVVFSSSCKKDEHPEPEIPSSSGRKVYISNEGALQYGNASISMYNIDKDSVYNDLYTQVNQKPLGDVAMAIYSDETQLYVIVNNSNKVVVLDKFTFKEKGSVSIFQPRNLEFYAPKKAYISSMYQPKVSVVDFESFQVIKEIAVDFQRGTEGLLFHNNAMYVCNWDTTCNYIYKINTNTHEISDRITVSGYAPQYVLKDQMGMIWVLSGNYQFNKPSVLTQLSHTGEIFRTIPLPTHLDVLKPTMDPYGEIIYVIGIDYTTNTSGIYKYECSNNSFPTQPFIASHPMQFFFTVAIDPKTLQIYVADSKGFNQLGDVHIYQWDGTHTKSFSCGIAPSFFAFDTE